MLGVKDVARLVGEVEERGAKLVMIGEVTPMSQTKNDSKRETFFINY